MATSWLRARQVPVVRTIAASLSCSSRISILWIMDEISCPPEPLDAEGESKAVAARAKAVAASSRFRPGRSPAHSVANTGHQLEATWRQPKLASDNDFHAPACLKTGSKCPFTLLARSMYSSSPYCSLSKHTSTLHQGPRCMFSWQLAWRGDLQYSLC